MSKSWTITGTDRQRGAIGIMEPFAHTVTAENEELARIACRIERDAMGRQDVLCMTVSEQSAESIIRAAYLTQPHLRLAVNRERNCIGSWDAARDSFVVVACLAITGTWVSMPYEILINGKRPVREWIEIPRESAA